MKQKIKIIIAGFLTKPFWGFLIKLGYKDFIQKDNLKFSTNSDGVGNAAIASLFFGFYESAEIRFVKKYLRSDLSVIELGSSLGIIATYSRAINKNKLICVEANPSLISAIERNFQLNNIENFTIINAAIGYSDRMFFEKGPNNVSGKLSTIFSERSIEVDMVSLNSILNKYAVGGYVLICDIEGAEAQLLKNDSEALRNCQQIIIETHEGELDGVRFSPATLKEKIINLGFILVDKYGSNFVFKKL